MNYLDMIHKRDIRSRKKMNSDTENIFKKLILIDEPDQKTAEKWSNLLVARLGSDVPPIFMKSRLHDKDLEFKLNQDI